MKVSARGQSDVSLTPGQNVTWYTSVIGAIYMHNLTHTIALVFPPGITKAITYVGVTIWLQARND
jgi:hypothetical protein